jgi:hypothetical protein
MPLVSLTRALVVAALCLQPVLARAGALKDIEDNAGPAPPRDPPAEHPDQPAYAGGSSAGGSSVVNDEEQSSNTISSFWLYVLLFPWKVPKLLVDDPCAAGFADYPYADGRGSLRRDPLRGGCEPLEPAADRAPPAHRRWAVQTDLEGAYALAGVLGGTLGMRLQLPRRVEFGGRVSLLRDLKAAPREQALHGTAHMSVRFAQAPHVELRSGLGMRAFALDRRLFGFDFLYAIDVFGKRPIVSRMEFHLGTLGDAGAGQARLTVGVMLRKLEIYAGYDHTAFWGHLGTTRLTGPVAGLRAWF